MSFCCLYYLALLYSHARGEGCCFLALCPLHFSLQRVGLGSDLLGSSTSSERPQRGLEDVHSVLVSVLTAKKSPDNLKPAVLYQGVAEQRSHRNKPTLYQM